MRSRRIKDQILFLLQSKDFSDRLDELCLWPLRQVVNPLFSLLLSMDDKVKWRAVTALGFVTARLAKEDGEAARVIVRRLIWQLNDESGGIGWGAPEAIGEIVARHDGLAREFGCYPLAYIREDCNFLEYEPLQRGAVWAVGRVAQVRPELVKDAVPHLIPFLASPDGPLRGLSSWALGLVSPGDAPAALEALIEDNEQIPVYVNGELLNRSVGALAREALDRIRRLRGSET